MELRALVSVSSLWWSMLGLKMAEGIWLSFLLTDELDIFSCYLAVFDC